MEKKADKDKVYAYTNEVYPRRLWIIVDNEELAKKRFFIDGEGDTMEPIDDDVFRNSYATTIVAVENNGVKRRGILIHFNKSLLDEGGSEIVSTIAHEALHATNMIFRALGVEYTLNADEHAAYLAGWVAKKCWLVLQKFI